MLIIAKILLTAIDSGAKTETIDNIASVCARFARNKWWHDTLAYAHGLRNGVTPEQYRAIVRTALCAIVLHTDYRRRRPRG